MQQQLQAMLDTGQSSVILLEGREGVGKSRLVDELQGTLRQLRQKQNTPAMVTLTKGSTGFCDVNKTSKASTPSHFCDDKGFMPGAAVTPKAEDSGHVATGRTPSVTLAPTSPRILNKGSKLRSTASSTAFPTLLHRQRCPLVILGGADSSYGTQRLQAWRRVFKDLLAADREKQNISSAQPRSSADVPDQTMLSCNSGRGSLDTPDGVVEAGQSAGIRRGLSDVSGIIKSANPLFSVESIKSSAGTSITLRHSNTQTGGMSGSYTSALGTHLAAALDNKWPDWRSQLSNLLDLPDFSIPYGPPEDSFVTSTLLLLDSRGPSISGKPVAAEPSVDAIHGSSATAQTARTATSEDVPGLDALSTPNLLTPSSSLGSWAASPGKKVSFETIKAAAAMRVRLKRSSDSIKQSPLSQSGKASPSLTASNPGSGDYANRVAGFRLSGAGLDEVTEMGAITLDGLGNSNKAGPVIYANGIAGTNSKTEDDVTRPHGVRFADKHAISHSAVDNTLYGDEGMEQEGESSDVLTPIPGVSRLQTPTPTRPWGDVVANSGKYSMVSDADDESRPPSTSISAPLAVFPRAGMMNMPARLQPATPDISKGLLLNLQMKRRKSISLLDGSEFAVDCPSGYSRPFARHSGRHSRSGLDGIFFAGEYDNYRSGLQSESLATGTPTAQRFHRKSDTGISGALWGDGVVPDYSRMKTLRAAAVTPDLRARRSSWTMLGDFGNNDTSCSIKIAANGRTACLVSSISLLVEVSGLLTVQPMTRACKVVIYQEAA